MSAELSPEDRQRLKTLFERAADLPPSQQAQFVERECGSHGALQVELSRLLVGLESEDRLDPARPGAPLGPGTRIGPYKLLERVGEGGMGEVYAADQLEPVARRVALKVIKPGMDSAQVVARFEAERQALARMSHSNVAQVFDGGTTEGGRPYFVMEYVAGDPITDYCDRRRLSTRARIELFLSVCEGVQHAHQKGLVHRDLKPSNLLVSEQDGRAVPKVIDFGVARATTGSLAERTLYTMVGQIIGTLDYMSPEQADPTSVDVDTRSDIYSLGVLLYQLVSGLLPFDNSLKAGRPLSDIQRAIREEDPPTPSTRLRRETGTATAIAPLHGTDERSLVRQLAGDLDWIALKALEKDPARRYASASELADDLRRHLAHEPVLAGRPGALYRASKFVRRNRVAVTAGVLVTATSVLGIAGIVSGRLEAAAMGAKLLPLADGSVLKYLMKEAERDLWPAHPDMLAAMQEWLGRARELAPNLPAHRRNLEEIRSGVVPEVDDAGVPTWRFDSPTDQLLHDDLAELVAGLEAFEAGLLEEDGVTAEHGWSVPKRVRFAQRLEAESAPGGEWDARWSEAIGAIVEHPEYAGLELTPQAGLVPIGPDDFSTLWEFWHVASGEEPARGADGQLLLTDESGIVLVLIPGGGFWMGSQWEDEDRMNYDPDSKLVSGTAPYEYPEHRVEVPPLFLSKYEMTQGQWLRIQGSNPSMETVFDENEVILRDKPVNYPLDPVNLVSAVDCDQATRRMGLTLPHEKQWEYANRAGTNTVWPTGDESSSLEGFANIHDGEGPVRAVAVHANFPNDWGLHGMIGNVKEWCSNRPYHYDTGEISARELGLRVGRGGNFRSDANFARAAGRNTTFETASHAAMGLRPSRGIER